MELNYASFWRRLAALLLDGLIVGGVSMVISMVVILPMTLMGASGDSDSSTIAAVSVVVSSLLNILLSVMQIGYMVYFTGKDGQTLGKKALGIKVLSVENGSAPLGYGKAIIREFVGRLVDGLTLGIGYLIMIGDSKKQTLHDKIAGTVVVRV